LVYQILKFGIQHPSFTHDGQGAQIIDTLSTLGKTAEQLGYDSLWMMDHFHQIEYVGKPEEPMLEGWATISVLAGLTSKLKFGTMVTGNIYRHPSVLATFTGILQFLQKSARLWMS